jgi:hypothetical protein
MLFLIRGHIRNGFDTEDLYNFVKQMYQLYKVDIYIQTWSVFSNSISWRPIPNNPIKVTDEIIRAYFKDIPIKSILILDDTKITITGNTSGVVKNSGIPIIGWKNMWYGKATIADHIAESEHSDTLLINTRFDLFCNSNNPTVANLLLFVEKNNNTTPTSLIFMSSLACCGIDNFYITTVAINRTLSQHFNTSLDEIMARPEYGSIGNPEKLVFYENARIFRTTPPAVFCKLGVFRR